LSKLGLADEGKSWAVTMSEGRNRQIRRTFAALGYQVTKLHRTQFGDYLLGSLELGSWIKA
jgi:23S rRNA pseudouridine2605 synthase